MARFRKEPRDRIYIKKERELSDTYFIKIPIYEKIDYNFYDVVFKIKGSWGYLCIQRRQYDKATADYNKAIEINPRYAMAYFSRAVAYFYKYEYEEAWDDVYRAQNLKYKVSPEFLKALRQASGRQK